MIRRTKIRFQLQPIYQRHGQAVVKDAEGRPCRLGMRVRALETVYFGADAHTVRKSVVIESDSARAIADAKRRLRRVVHEAVCDLGKVGLANEILKATGEIADRLAAMEDRLASTKAAIHAEAERAVALKNARTLTFACLYYLEQPRRKVRAGMETRRIYDGYVRNHIAVPTAQGREALGSLEPSQVDDDVLQLWEESIYQDRSGYKMAEYAFQYGERKGTVLSADDFASGFAPTLSEVFHVQSDPRTVEKFLHFLSSAVQFCIENHPMWKDLKNPIKGYTMVEDVYEPTKMDVPRSDLFVLLVRRAAAHSRLHYMIPFMALVRNTFRPSEARGLRKRDVVRVDTRKGKVWKAQLGGTIKSMSGGEAWVPEAKTRAAIEEYVFLPNSTVELLETYSRAGCEYFCFPAEGQTHPFLSKDKYAEGWRELLKLEGLDTQMSPYTLKHGLITELILMNVNAEMISKITRHTTVEMINRVYASLDSSRLAEIIDKLDRDSGLFE